MSLETGIQLCALLCLKIIFLLLKKKVYGNPPSSNNISYKKLSCLLLLPNHWDLKQATKEGKTPVD